MSVVSEDVLWLEPLYIDNEIEMMKTTLAYQIGSLSSLTLSNISSSSSSSFSSSSYLPILTNSSSMTTVLSNDKRFLILKWSVRIIGCLLIIVGGIGNTLSALTLSRKKLRTQVTSIYLIALALSDLGNVFFSVLNFYLVRIDPNRNMRLYSNISCKFHIFFTYYFINLSPTLLVAVSVQRYLAIAKHHYSKKHCTVKNAYTLIGLICLISFFIELHWAIFYELQIIPIKQISTSSSSSSTNRTILYRRVCNISSNYPKYLQFRSHILGYIQWFFFTLCPFIIMLILNSLILNVITSSRRIQQQHTNQKNQRKKIKQRNLTIMLLSVSCVFILLTAPASTFMAFGHLFKNLHGRNSQSLWTMFSLIYYTNTAANFLLYFLTANVFRQELRVMISSVPGCSKILPEQFQILQNNTNISGGIKLTPLGKIQMTTNPVITSATLLCEDENINGINRKYAINNSNNR
ncbi:unnamed protein product [Rotaria sordida]|uniref:G-protein coupled receptors family 1 profile domain-containing protein n=1 Tax=Rotaria sordida TaxID=392033 RepID=A0A818NG02_9BILA|nr:unnamed protein product [Rotaria sordida]CAF1315069.1 unnamed protein product [Rotaria sordida]CAF1443493.1 unnamed protein product [Rotaria sordida]CAF3603346.1 unnamed protein product [Rotaria sordida]CAF3619139.1 unnamed protein product [Rotaria sordida]